MLSTIAARNQSILRRTFVRGIATRLFSTQAVRRFYQLRLAPKCSTHPKRLQLWNTSFVRTYADAYPAHVKVNLPALSPTMERGTIISWEKKEGDKLNEGDLLAEIETDKATMGFETPEEGFLAKILVAAGTKDVPIGKLVCIIVENEADIAAFKDFKDDAPAGAPAPVVHAPNEPVVLPTATAPPPAATPAAAPGPRPMTAVEQRGDRVYASPMAKRLAEAQQLRLQGKGSGLYGSIKSTDLAGMSAADTSAIASAGAPAGPSTRTAPGTRFVDIPVSTIRDVIAKRLLESKQTVPHYYVTMECNVDRLLEFRQQLNKKLEKKKMKVSVNDFIIKATAAACVAVPETNSRWKQTFIRQYENVDVSVAVSTPTGLITPIVYGAERKGVVQISQEIRDLASRAREGKLKPEEFQGGTVCISNLGMYGVTHFCAVINPPQACILAVGGAMKKLVPDPDDPKGFKAVNVMNVTLSADHRVVDGASAATWLGHFRSYMEDPANMIV